MRPATIRVLMLVALVLATHLGAQTTWSHVVDYPVLDYGGVDSWEAGSITRPYIIRDGDTLKMWYTGIEGNLMGGRRIGYAWSLDGIVWNRYPENPLSDISGSAGPVLKENGIYKMWYGEGPAFRYATSPNGIDWTPHPDPIFTMGNEGEWDGNIPIFTPDCIVKKDGTYMFWYTGSIGAFPNLFSQFGMATSTDGINWTKHDDPTTTEAPFANGDPVMVVGAAGQWDALHLKGACVMKKDDGFEMWYSGLGELGPNQWLGYATSSDGIHWTKHAENPIVKTLPSWGGWGYTPGTILKLDSTYHMWYDSFNEMGDNPRIGYMTSIRTNITPHTNNLPSHYAMIQNFPNPFNPKTTIEISIPKSEFITLDIYNIIGQKVATLESAILGAGSHSYTWDASDQQSGVFLYQLKTANYLETRKMLLVR
jgi:hypothetical protein